MHSARLMESIITGAAARLGLWPGTSKALIVACDKSTRPIILSGTAARLGLWPGMYKVSLTGYLQGVHDSTPSRRRTWLFPHNRQSELIKPWMQAQGESSKMEKAPPNHPSSLQWRSLGSWRFNGPTWTFFYDVFSLQPHFKMHNQNNHVR